ncbi:methylenetetrahydrofolate reductase [NAD(P)H] [Sandaracinomonas limnophila]|uniref:Methylenetetrahydrofolate reductase n=1 Tax=Sandaracinomonas limnophila TaxID=1862386 RepID=A0A437PQU7_9BACT|nr:methylenetetrahydrofolate reductase [NAD(P)H] [Sandaracinomonas limnophila]RVU24624.1 methylenetetrahydrofolate reductase [NAD(P)H] [Sandaracinomonas limnophila]
MTKITEYFNQAKGKTLFSLEIIPPMKGSNFGDLMQNIEPLMEFNPPFIEVTYHREEYITKEVNGETKRIPIRKRPGTLGICAAIMQKFKVEAVPHVICGGFTKEETEDFLIDLHYLGIENILALRGDQEKGETHFIPKSGGHAFANELVEQISAMNQGKLLYEETESFPTNFCVGVAGYPEKHFEAISLEEDLQNLKRKVDAGADYIVTQMFFDNRKYFDFVDKCRAIGINVPIIPGLKPLSTARQLQILPEIFFLDIPEDLQKAVKACTAPEQIKQVGIEWTIAQGRELMQAGVPALHFYTMSKSDNVQAIAKSLF